MHLQRDSSRPRCTHIMFDFFGTLVSCLPNHAERSFALTHQVLRNCGATWPYQYFLVNWERTFDAFRRRRQADHREFSMDEVGTAVLREALGRRPRRAEVDALVAEYMVEWNAGVGHLPGVVELVRGLAGRYRLAIVSDTHHAPLVPGHLAALGLTDAFTAVITSVEVGWCKPHPKIYAVALDALSASAEQTVFVGDSHEPDYAGPQRVGISAYLIDPEFRSAVPPERRLTSVLDLPTRLQEAVA